MPKVKRFTDAWVKALPNHDKRTEYRNEADTGFVMAVRGNSKTWLYIFTFMGRKFVLTLGHYPDMGLSEARALYTAAALQKKSGTNPALIAQQKKREDKQAVLESRREHTVSDLIQVYLNDYAKKRKRSWPEDERILNKHIKPVLGDYSIKSITKHDIRPIIKKLEKEGKEAMARRVLATVRKMFAYACSEDIDGIEHNPCQYIKTAPPKARERSLTAKEIKILWYGIDATTMNESSKRIIRLNFLTGSRHSELRGLRWDEIHDDIAIIPASRMKGGRAHCIPLTKTALDIIGEPNGSEYVFPSPATGRPLDVSATTHALKRVLDDIKIDEFPDEKLSNVRIHDIRKSVNNHLAELGISQFDRDRVLAHVDGSVNGKNYTVYDFAKEKRAALEKWEQKLLSILGVKADDKTAGKVLQFRQKA